jgi:hypothetical protein
MRECQSSIKGWLLHVMPHGQEMLEGARMVARGPTAAQPTRRRQ